MNALSLKLYATSEPVRDVQTWPRLRSPAPPPRETSPSDACAGLWSASSSPVDTNPERQEQQPGDTNFNSYSILRQFTLYIMYLSGAFLQDQHCIILYLPLLFMVTYYLIKLIPWLPQPVTFLA